MEESKRLIFLSTKRSMDSFTVPQALLSHHTAALSQLSSAPDSPWQCEVTVYKVSESPHCAPSSTFDLFNHHISVQGSEATQLPARQTQSRLFIFSAGSFDSVPGQSQAGSEPGTLEEQTLGSLQLDLSSCWGRLLKYLKEAVLEVF